MLTEIFDGCGIAILAYSRSVNVIAAAAVNDDNDHLYGDHDSWEAIMMLALERNCMGFFTLSAAANY